MCVVTAAKGLKMTNPGYISTNKNTHSSSCHQGSHGKHSQPFVFSDYYRKKSILNEKFEKNAEKLTANSKK